ncbi:hypothetical protein BV378_32170 [Nostoc sp. RF31YmG]|jgi:hypothetical protein|nr:hypothetical protein BV378_32170 [Nostoc sp. RF31YmG]
MSQAQEGGIEKDIGKDNYVFAFHPDVYLNYQKATKININYEFWMRNYKTNGVYHLRFNVASIFELK